MCEYAFPIMELLIEPLFSMQSALIPSSIETDPLNLFVNDSRHTGFHNQGLPAGASPPYAEHQLDPTLHVGALFPHLPDRNVARVTWALYKTGRYPRHLDPSGVVVCILPLAALLLSQRAAAVAVYSHCFRQEILKRVRWLGVAFVVAGESMLGVRTQ